MFFEQCLQLEQVLDALARRSLAPSGKRVGSGGDGPSDFGGGRKRNTSQKFGGGGIHNGQQSASLGEGVVSLAARERQRYHQPGLPIPRSGDSNHVRVHDREPSGAQ